jgi:hypothetical protein
MNWILVVILLLGNVEYKVEVHTMVQMVCSPIANSVAEKKILINGKESVVKEAFCVKGL